MSIKETVQAGNKIIRSKSIEVLDATSSETKIIVENLIDSMRHEGLVGMAAPQIGSNLRIFVSEIRETEVRKERIDELRVFINPKIVSSSDTLNAGYEGCGSVASGGLFGPVERSDKVKVIAQNESGEKFELNADELLARVIQHEVDHLNGVLFIDHVKDMKKVMSRSEYIKQKR